MNSRSAGAGRDGKLRELVEKWRHEWGWNNDARSAYVQAADELDAILADTGQGKSRFFWVMERKVPDGHWDGAPVYWDGGHAESSTRDIHKAVQWCRKDDLLNCLMFTKHYQQWGWTPVEHGIMAAPIASDTGQGETPLHEKAVADRDARPWVYYKLDRAALVNLLNEQADIIARLKAAGSSAPLASSSETQGEDFNIRLGKLRESLEGSSKEMVIGLALQAIYDLNELRKSASSVPVRASGEPQKEQPHCENCGAPDVELQELMCRSCWEQEPETPRFHWRDGVYFQRVDQGAVLMTLPQSWHVIPKDEWASILTHLSASASPSDDGARQPQEPK